MTITERLTAKGNAARGKALEILAKPSPSAAELDRLPGLLTAAGLAIADAESASGLLAEQEYLQGVVNGTDPERSSALADELREHEAETLQLIAERREQQRELERQLATLGHQHSKAEQAKGRLVEVREELRKLAGEPEPDVAEAYIRTAGDGSSYQSAPDRLQGPVSRPVVLTAANYKRELKRREAVLQAFDAATLREREREAEQAAGVWDERFNEESFARQKHYDRGDHGKARAMASKLGPRPTMRQVTYRDAIEAGQHRTESEATYAA